mmetsp:Transcript_17728/g.38526  ORF Transcript_17728/g.38526 Transcript_17728/m.38526 type:complete len:349 (+) Transcript_17728:216-1262(+)
MPRSMLSLSPSLAIALAIVALFCLPSPNEGRDYMLCDYVNLGTGTRCDGPTISSNPWAYDDAETIYPQYTSNTNLGTSASRFEYCEEYCSNDIDCLGFLTDPGNPNYTGELDQVRCWISRQEPTGVFNDGLNGVESCQKKLVDSCRSAPTQSPTKPPPTSAPTEMHRDDPGGRSSGGNSFFDNRPVWFWPILAFAMLTFMASMQMVCYCRRQWLKPKAGAASSAATTNGHSTTTTNAGDPNVTFFTSSQANSNTNTNTEQHGEGLSSIFANVMSGLSTSSAAANGSTAWGFTSSSTGGGGGISSSTNGGVYNSSGTDYGGGCTSSGTGGGCDFGSSGTGGGCDFGSSY